jgi:DNA polymerase-4
VFYSLDGGWPNKCPFPEDHDFWRLIRGEEIEERESARASISHSRVLPPNDRTAEHAWSNLVALLSKAAMRLREEGFYTRSLQLHLEYFYQGSGIDYWDNRSRFFETQDTTFLLSELKTLWAKARKHNILKIGVVVSSLVPVEKHQLSLFENTKQSKLMMAIDKLNKTHRKNLVLFGDSAELERPSAAPIAFGHIPEKYE